MSYSRICRRIPADHVSTRSHISVRWAFRPHHNHRTRAHCQAPRNDRASSSNWKTRENARFAEFDLLSFEADDATPIVDLLVRSGKFRTNYSAGSLHGLLRCCTFIARTARPELFFCISDGRGFSGEVVGSHSTTHKLLASKHHHIGYTQVPTTITSGTSMASAKFLSTEHVRILWGSQY